MTKSLHSQLFRHAQLPTVKACSQSYVNKVKGELESMGCRIKTSCLVKSVSSFDGGTCVIVCLLLPVQTLWVSLYILLIH
jgi:hypothetical protein